MKKKVVSDEAVNEETADVETTPEPAPVPTPVEEEVLAGHAAALVGVLNGAGIQFEKTPGKIALIVGKHAGVHGKHETVVTFEYRRDGSVFRVTCG